MTSQCGLVVVDLDTGSVLHALQIGGVVEELFDVVVLPNVRQPRALGFQDDDIDRLISFPGSAGIMTTKPTIKRSNLSQSTQVTGLSRASQWTQSEDIVIKYQRVYHLTRENLFLYESMTYPSLQKRWQTQSRRGELFGVSASVEGEMVGFAVAECWQESEQSYFEVLLSYVLSAYRHQPIERQLHQHLRQAINHLSFNVNNQL